MRVKGAIGTRRARGKMVWWVEVLRPYGVSKVWSVTHKAPHHFGTAMQMATKFFIHHYLDRVRLRNEVTGDTLRVDDLHRPEAEAFLVKNVHLA